SGGTYSVQGDHAYGTAGSYSVMVGLQDADGQMVMAAGSATVLAAPVYTLATFSNPDEPASAFSVSLDWGDLTSPTPGNITGSGSSYQVTGRHAYAVGGTYTITVSITDYQGQVTTVAD